MFRLKIEFETTRYVVILVIRITVKKIENAKSPTNVGRKTKIFNRLKRSEFTSLALPSR